MLAFTAAQPPVDREPIGSAVGIDRGVAISVATSTGQHLRAPHRGKAERKAGKLAAWMSRQHRGSRRRHASREAVGKVHTRAADRRKDWVDKTSTALVRDHDVIVLEDLRVQNMVRRPAPKPDPSQDGVFLVA